MNQVNYTELGNKFKQLFDAKVNEEIEVYGPLAGYHVLAVIPDSYNDDEVPEEDLLMIEVSGPFAVGKMAIHLPPTKVPVSVGDKYIYVLKDGTVKSTVEPLENECLICMPGKRFDIPNRRVLHTGFLPEFGDVSWIEARLPENQKGRKLFRSNVLNSRNSQLWKIPPIDEPDSIECAEHAERMVLGLHSKYSLPYINRACGYSLELEVPDDTYTDMATLPGNANEEWFYPADDTHYHKCKQFETMIAMNKKVHFSDCYFDHGDVPCVFQGQQTWGEVGLKQQGSIIDRCTFVNENGGDKTNVPIMAYLGGLRMTDCLGWECGADFIQAGPNASSFENCAAIWVGTAGGGKHGDGFQINGDFGFQSDMIDLDLGPVPNIFSSKQELIEYSSQHPCWLEQYGAGNRFVKVGLEYDFEPYYLGTDGWEFGWGDISNIPTVARGGTTAFFRNKNWVGYCPGKCTPWGKAEAEGNGSVYISSTYGDTRDAYIVGGYHTGGSCPVQIEHRRGNRVKNLHFKDMLIGIDNEFGFASMAHTEISNDRALPDPIVVWENNRRVDTGELIRKPVVKEGATNDKATWADYR